jgi:hypothetical protein
MYFIGQASLPSTPEPVAVGGRPGQSPNSIAAAIPAINRFSNSVTDDIGKFSTELTLAGIRRDGQVVTCARRQRQQHDDPGEREAQPRPLHRRLWVRRLVFRRHGDVRPIDNEHRPFHFHASAAVASSSTAVRVANVRRIGVRRRLRAWQ